MPPLELATAHKLAREDLTSRATARALRLWRQVPVSDLDRGWDVVAPQLLLIGSAAQAQAVTQATTYVGRVSAYYGGAEPARLVPQAFAGVGADGRGLVPAAYGAVTTTKTLIGRGMAAEQAFLVGASFLATIFGAAIQDTGRSADLTLGTARGYPRYVRVVSPGACSRCAILAGKGSASVAFERHPRCKCGVWLMPDDDALTPPGMFDNSDDYFASLNPAQQDKTFTKSGAFAIRNGADPVKVVNARRGAINRAPSGRLQPVTIGRRADGTPLQVFATTEGTTARGAFGRSDGNRRSPSIRLMPEQILKMAGDNPARARELLSRYGYID